MCRKSVARTFLLIGLTAGLMSLSYCRAQDSDIVAKRTITLLSNLINSPDPIQFSKEHNIRLKNGKLKVVITLDEDLLSPGELASKYAFKDFRKKKNIVTAYVAIDSLKELCKEEGVVFIRLPFRFVGE